VLIGADGLLCRELILVGRLAILKLVVFAFLWELVVPTNGFAQWFLVRGGILGFFQVIDEACDAWFIACEHNFSGSFRFLGWLPIGEMLWR
jgi:hypothetical protein